MAVIQRRMLRQLVSLAPRRLLLRDSQESVLPMKRAALISALLLAGSPAAMATSLNSPAFQPNGHIPSKYTCEGEDISPPLAWEGVPNEAKSIVLIIDDPDAPDPKAPKIVWVHWVVYNMPADTKSLPENAGKARLPQGAFLGPNDFKKTEYGGPCPPIGRHRYFHKPLRAGYRARSKRRDEIADRASNAGSHTGQCRAHRHVSKG